MSEIFTSYASCMRPDTHTHRNICTHICSYKKTFSAQTSRSHANHFAPHLYPHRFFRLLSQFSPQPMLFSQHTNAIYVHISTSITCVDGKSILLIWTWTYYTQLWFYASLHRRKSRPTRIRGPSMKNAKWVLFSGRFLKVIWLISLSFGRKMSIIAVLSSIRVVFPLHFW